MSLLTTIFIISSTCLIKADYNHVNFSQMWEAPQEWTVIMILDDYCSSQFLLKFNRQNQIIAHLLFGIYFNMNLFGIPFA